MPTAASGLLMMLNFVLLVLLFLVLLTHATQGAKAGSILGAASEPA